MYLILFLGSNSLTIPVCQTFQSHEGLENLADKKKKDNLSTFWAKKRIVYNNNDQYLFLFHQ